MQFGTNHLGHFALTGLLLPAITRGARRAGGERQQRRPHARARSTSKTWTAAKSYHRWRAYSQSKLANLLFSLRAAAALRRRRSRRDQRRLPPRLCGDQSPVGRPANGRLALRRAPDAGWVTGCSRKARRHGALPTLYAATAAGVNGGDYIGPVGAGDARCSRQDQDPGSRSYDAAVAARLWQVSEQLTGVRYSV